MSIVQSLIFVKLSSSRLKYDYALLYAQDTHFPEAMIQSSILHGGQSILYMVGGGEFPVVCKSRQRPELDILIRGPHRRSPSSQYRSCAVLTSEQCRALICMLRTSGGFGSLHFAHSYLLIGRNGLSLRHRNDATGAGPSVSPGRTCGAACCPRLASTYILSAWCRRGMHIAKTCVEMGVGGRELDTHGLLGR
jgi:hypothetical protein